MSRQRVVRSVFSLDVAFRPLINRSMIPMAHLRHISTKRTTSREGQEILARQRLLRPVSPHLAIYRPQITSILSVLHRNTGLVLSGGLYLFGIAYLSAPMLGWQLDTSAMVAAVASWPTSVKYGLKSVLGLSFFFHCWNGVRHLGWDLGYGLRNRQVIRSGWLVVGLSAAATVYYVASTGSSSL